MPMNLDISGKFVFTSNIKDRRCQDGSQKLLIERQMIPWPKEKGQNDKLWFIKHYTK
jgi:hypothetical protein